MKPLERIYLVLADAILILHFSFVAFVLVGFFLVWIGWWRRWPWVRNFWFRMAHLAAIGFVAAESTLGIVCPLTKWEDRLRMLAGGEQHYVGSFVQHWLHRFMFFDVEERVFTIVYVIFFLVVVLSFCVVSPRRAQRSG